MGEDKQKKPKIVAGRNLADRVADDLEAEERYATGEPLGKVEKPAAKPDNTTKWLAICAIAIFVAAFLFFSLSRGPAGYDVDGVRFESPSGPPDQVVKKVLAPDAPALVAEQPMTGDATCTYGMLIQLSAGLGASNKRPAVQVKSNGKCVGFDSPDPADCAENGILVRQGKCNCVKMSETQMVVEGNDDFLCNNSVKISDFIAYSMTGRHLDLAKANELLKKYQEEQMNKTIANVTGDIEPDAVNVSDEKLGEPLIMPALNESENATAPAAGEGALP